MGTSDEAGSAGGNQYGGCSKATSKARTFVGRHGEVARGRGGRGENVAGADIPESITRLVS